jgi:hypothetical protein
MTAKALNGKNVVWLPQVKLLVGFTCGCSIHRVDMWETCFWTKTPSSLSNDIYISAFECQRCVSVITLMIMCN